MRGHPLSNKGCEPARVRRSPPQWWGLRHPGTDLIQRSRFYSPLKKRHISAIFPMGLGTTQRATRIATPSTYPTTFSVSITMSANPACPNRAGNASCHARRHPNRCVNSDEVIPCDPKRYAGFVIRQLAAVGVGSAGIAAKVHPDAQVQSFNVAYATQ